MDSLTQEFLDQGYTLEQSHRLADMEQALEVTPKGREAIGLPVGITPIEPAQVPEVIYLPPSNDAIRKWFASQGTPINARGRIPQTAIAEYMASQNGGLSDTPSMPRSSGVASIPAGGNSGGNGVRKRRSRTS